MSDEGGYSRSAESKITFLDAITALKEDRGTILGEKLALEKEVAELRVFHCCVVFKASLMYEFHRYNWLML